MPFGPILPNYPAGLNPGDRFAYARVLAEPFLAQGRVVQPVDRAAGHAPRRHKSYR